MLTGLTNHILDIVNCGGKNSGVDSGQNKRLPFVFDSDGENKYHFPSVYEEADEMLQLSLLVYTLTQLRTLAKYQKRNKNNNEKHIAANNVDDNMTPLSSSPSLLSLERILSLPLCIESCIDMIEDNFECIKQEIGDDDHDMTKSALLSIKQRYVRRNYRLQHRKLQEKNISSKRNNYSKWWGDGSDCSMSSAMTVEEQQEEIKVADDALSYAMENSSPPSFVAYGDENPSTDLVYSIVVDPTRKRITVVFRGSVTVSDFFTDACIVFQRQPNPICAHLFDEDRCEFKHNGNRGCIIDSTSTVGIHYGFFEYMFSNKKGKTSSSDAVDSNGHPDTNSGSFNKTSKYTEILGLLTTLFQVHSGYKLYVTGHSLGGALATLFSFYVSAAVASSEISTTKAALATSPSLSISIIPTPISCISIASPRVGDQNFVYSFQLLERRGVLRHLRIANDRDPITVMPKYSGKKIWAMLSPASYIAFKLSDQSFEKKEMYHHTGIKLKLFRKSSSEKNKNIDNADCGTGSEEKYDYSYDIQYSQGPYNQNGASRSLENNRNENTNISAALFPSFMKEDIPDAVYHMGSIYCENLKNLRNELQGMTINQLYQQYAVDSQ